MRILLIAVGNRMPRWVSDGYEEYARRLPRECSLQLIEIAPGKRGKNADVARILRDEGERMLAAIPKGAKVITLEVEGQAWDTPRLAREMAGWLHEGRDISLLVGGPEGLPEACRQPAEQHWSLSALTLPHPLVRVVLAEQIYRGWSLLKGHPYHRE